jgi:hypothetical protein
MSMNIGRFGLMSLLTQAALGGGSGFIEASTPKAKSPARPIQRRIAEPFVNNPAGSKLAKRKARDKQLFRP